MGGYVAMEIMKKAPERVLKLAMIDTMVRPDDEARTKARRGLLTLAQLGRFKGVTPQLLPKLVHPRCIGTAIADTVQEMAAAVGKEGFVRQQLAIIERPDYRPLLKSIVVPTLIVVGESDEITLQLSPKKSIAAYRILDWWWCLNVGICRRLSSRN